MKLRELLAYDNIIIQAHDNPDADAIASGYGLLCYFHSHGKNARLIYGGRNPIRKSNLVLMTERLEIPAEHVRELPEEPELLLTVDCQFGERNVQAFSGKTVAVIDHHMARLQSLPAFSEIRDNYGSCATVIWDMLKEEGFEVSKNQRLATAFYYGLFMDTNKMQELRHPKDRDMRDELEFCCSKSLLFFLQNSNLTREELKIAGNAMSHIEYEEGRPFAVAEAERCDPNILGIISDALIEVDTINTCVVFCVLDDGVKLSVRSCERETRADELAAFLAAGIGSGGGHIRKSGGFLVRDRLLQAFEGKYGIAAEDTGEAARRLLTDRMEEYFRDQDYVTAGSDSVPDLSMEPVYEKLRLPIGYVRAKDIYPVGTPVSVRMLEGDIPFTILEDTYFIIGIEGEVYKNDEEYFLSHNDPTDEPYEIRGEYAPTLHMAVNPVGISEDVVRQVSLQNYAKACVPKGSSRIHARVLTKRTKIFVSWSDSYMLGNPGDYIACRLENPKDVYIIRGDIMKKSYRQL